MDRLALARQKRTVLWIFPFILLLAWNFLHGAEAAKAAGQAPAQFRDNALLKEWLLEKASSGVDRKNLQYEQLLLPDLRTLPPFDLQLLVNPASGKRVIRFSNSVWNSGAGPLEVHGSYHRKNSGVGLTQFIRGSEITGMKHRVGELTYHAIHGHWHWEGFSVYEIWSLSPDGVLDEIVASSGKVGYCMMDISRIEDEWIQKSNLKGFSSALRPHYGGCNWRLQGISTGWVDTYIRDIPGQEIDVSGLPDGIFALKSTVDPQGALMEVDTTNNTGTVYFSLQGYLLQVLGEHLPWAHPMDFMK